MTDMPWRDAINRVLQANDGPLHYTEIANRIVEQGLRKRVGATPPATVAAVLADSIKNKGAESPYERVERGTYRLRRSGADISERRVEPPIEEEENPRILTSYGVHWNREDVVWKTHPALLGVFQTDGVSKSEPQQVDFSEQHGVYLLHDGREVIYVGCTTTGDLGKRLFDHTRDRLQGRWGRFSWFGFRPVHRDGTLGPKVGSLPRRLDMEFLIEIVEAILIEAVEPRQNRQQGKRVRGFEYRQVPDPEVKRETARRAIDQL